MRYSTMKKTLLSLCLTCLLTTPAIAQTNHAHENRNRDHHKIHICIKNSRIIQWKSFCQIQIAQSVFRITQQEVYHICHKSGPHTRQHDKNPCFLPAVTIPAAKYRCPSPDQKYAVSRNAKCHTPVSYISMDKPATHH